MPNVSGGKRLLGRPGVPSRADPGAAGRRRDSGGARTAGPFDVGALLEVIVSSAMLPVLDNCEHFVAACAALAVTLLRACPGLDILVTSREALRVQNEHIVPMRPLLPPDEAPPVELLAGCPSVSLFVVGARAARPGFSPTEQQAPAISYWTRSGRMPRNGWRPAGRPPRSVHGMPSVTWPSPKPRDRGPEAPSRLDGSIPWPASTTTSAQHFAGT